MKDVIKTLIEAIAKNVDNIYKLVEDSKDDAKTMKRIIINNIIKI